MASCPPAPPFCAGPLPAHPSCPVPSLFIFPPSPLHHLLLPPSPHFHFSSSSFSFHLPPFPTPEILAQTLATFMSLGTVAAAGTPWLPEGLHPPGSPSVLQCWCQLSHSSWGRGSPAKWPLCPRCPLGMRVPLLLTFLSSRCWRCASPLETVTRWMRGMVGQNRTDKQAPEQVRDHKSSQLPSDTKQSGCQAASEL